MIQQRRPHHDRCGDGTRCGAEDRRFPTGTRESVKALHSGAPRRAGIRFPEKTGAVLQGGYNSV